MIIKYRYRVAFVHVAQTAGTNLVTALHGLDGVNSIVPGGVRHETAEEFLERAGLAEGDTMPGTRIRVGDYLFGWFTRNPWSRV